MNTHSRDKEKSGIAKLFTRRKKKAKNKDEKPHIALGLLPSVAFTAVPSSPPPASREGDTSLPRSASASVTSVRDPVQEMEYSDNDSEPGYTTVRSGHVRQATISQQNSRRDESTSVRKGIEKQRSSSVPPLSLPSSMSPPPDQVVSNSSLPSVTSSISLPSDSVNGSLPPPPPPSAITTEPRSPSVIDGIPVYAAVDKSKKKRQFQGSRNSNRAASHHQKSNDSQLSDDSDAPYPSFSPHRPPAPPAHRHRHRSSRSYTEPHTASSLDNLPVYTLSDAPHSLTGDYGYVFSRTSPEGEQQQFVATPVRITPAPSSDVGVPRSHSTPIHRQAHHQPQAAASTHGIRRSPSPTVRSPSPTTQIAAEILQQLASASLLPATNSQPTPSQSIPSFAGDRTTQVTAEILQQLAAGSLNGVESVDSSARHQPLREPGVPRQHSGHAHRKSGKITPTRMTAEILQQIAAGAQAKDTMETTLRQQPPGPSDDRLATNTSNSQQPGAAPPHHSITPQSIDETASLIASGVLQQLSVATLQDKSPRPPSSSTPRQSNEQNKEATRISQLVGELETLRGRNEELSVENTSWKDLYKRHKAESKAKEESLLQETSLLNDSIVRKEEEYIKAQERENRKHLMNAKSLEERLILASEENEQIQQQLQLQKKLNADMTRRHTTRVEQLNTELSELREQKNHFMTELASLRSSHAQLMGKMTVLSQSTPKLHVSIGDHREAMRQSELQSLNDMERKEAQLGELKRENAILKGKASGLEESMKSLQKQYRSLKSEDRSNEDKITMLEDQAYHKDLLSSRKLSEANAMIEKLTGERDNYARIAETQTKAKDQSLLEYARKELAVQKFHQRMMTYGQQVTTYSKKTEGMLKQQERRQRDKEHSYQQQLRQLKAQLRCHEEKLQEMEENKRKAEAKLNLLWSATNS